VAAAERVWVFAAREPRTTYAPKYSPDKKRAQACRTAKRNCGCAVW